MPKIKFVTDSTAYLSKEYIKNKDIKVVPLIVNFENKTEKEGYPGEFDEFFDRLKNSKDFPKTSQPAVGDFSEVYKEIIEDGNEIIAILFSSKLSGTYNSANLAAQIVNPEKITVIDSENAVGNVQTLIELGIGLAEKGFSREEILEKINIQKSKLGVRLTIDTLDYLHKGGRLSNAQALIGSILNIKPIIGLVDGKLIPIDKARGKKKAMQVIMSDIPENVNRIIIMHIKNEEEAIKFKEVLQQKYDKAEISINELGPVIGSHLGPKTLGICYSW